MIYNKKTFASYVCFLVVMLYSVSIYALTGIYGTYTGAEYIRNYDGDTVTFTLMWFPSIIGDDISIRVNGIDTPEMKGKCQKEKNLAKKAKDYVRNELSQANIIILKDMRRGKYFRIVADILYDDKNLANQLLNAGLAVRYDGGKKNKDWCK